jgi:hypothetical protein
MLPFEFSCAGLRFVVVCRLELDDTDANVAVLDNAVVDILDLGMEDGVARQMAVHIGKGRVNPGAVD